MRAVVLVGGFGTRLRPLTNTTPKPMLPVVNRPMLEHLVGGLARAGIGEVTLALGFKPEPFVQAFPGSERPPSLAEVQEIQKRLTALGFDTAGSDGRIGLETMKAVRDFQRKAGMTPADGYAGVMLLARLRQGL